MQLYREAAIMPKRCASDARPPLGFAPIAAILSALVAFPCGSSATASEWMTMREGMLTIEAGGPLDFSADRLPPPAGRYGPIRVSGDGRLAFEGIGVHRFSCGSMAVTPSSGGFPDHERADLYSEQLRLHGYDLVRFHLVDLTLMEGRERDFDYDPEQFDRFQYFLASLKKNGIYWIIDVMSNWNGAKGDVYPSRWDHKYDLRMEVYTQPEAYDHWKRMVDTILAVRNPHTGLTTLEDPALVAVINVNENDLELEFRARRVPTWRPYPEAMRSGFAAWVSQRVRKGDAIESIIDDASVDERADPSRVTLPGKWSSLGRERAFRSYLVDLQIQTYDSMRRYLKARGFLGLSTMYDGSYLTVDANRARQSLQLVDQHEYFDLHRMEIGSKSTQKSSLEDGGRFARGLSSSRWLGRPFVVTEYGIPYWNAHRGEASLIVPAIAALQSWDAICLYGAGPIELDHSGPGWRKNTLYPFFGLGYDPVTRAGETLSRFLFVRGDVRGSETTYYLDLSTLPDGNTPLPANFEALALTSRIGLVETTYTPPPEGARPLPRTDLVAALASGRAHIVSDTGEILLDQASRRMRVKTVATEATTLSKFKGEPDLDFLRVHAADGTGVISISSLDGSPLTRSLQLLLIFTTDASTSGAKFAEPERRTVLDYGTFPVVVRRGRVRLDLAMPESERFRIVPLGFDGRRAPEGHDRTVRGGQIFDLDNEVGGHPVTYWLVERSIP